MLTAEGQREEKNLLLKIRILLLGSNSFPKTERLLKRADFLRLSRSGKKIQTRFFIAAVLDGTTGNNRIGITVSKRVGKAVERNRIKRLIREYYRNRKETLPGNRDINIIARKYANFLSNHELVKALDELFAKLNKQE